MTNYAFQITYYEEAPYFSTTMHSDKAQCRFLFSFITYRLMKYMKNIDEITYIFQKCYFH